jgi:two-component system cell cycle response regulator
MKSTEERKRSKSLPTRVLLVEDSPGDASLVISALSEPIGLFAVKWVSTLEAAIEALFGAHYECLLVDLGLPDADGLDVVDSLRGTAGDSALVVLTGRSDEEMGLQAIQHGADDCILKSELSARALHRSINYAIERTRSKVDHWTRCPHGRTRS